MQRKEILLIAWFVASYLLVAIGMIFGLMGIIEEEPYDSIVFLFMAIIGFCLFGIGLLLLNYYTRKELGDQVLDEK